MPKPTERESSLADSYSRNKAYARPGPYVTKLTPAQDIAFQSWVNAKHVPFDLREANSDYDMRGFWLALQNHDPRALTAIDPYDHRMHFPDVWKTPYDRTFSRESKYALPTAPYWSKDGRYLIDQSGKILFDGESGAPGG